MSVARARRESTVRALADHLQSIGVLSERIAYVFATSHGVNTTEFRALGAIYSAELEGEPLTAKGLADALDLRPSTVSNTLDRLEASGHARRERDPRDGRRVLLRYGQVGLEVASRFFGPLAIAHGRGLDPFTDEELVVAERVLRALVATLSQFEGEVRDARTTDDGRPRCTPSGAQPS